MKSDSLTWAPFQSAAVREICAHMTEAEKAGAAARAALYGLWVAVSLSIPLPWVFMAKSHWVMAICVLLIVTHLACIPVWHKMQRRYLCATAWARAQGLLPDRLNLYSFRSKPC
ncbi:hypothetical protein [Verrucomicrobium sp. BvORR106]|uniref:hypothetical protein n=1 Tax=Verrucomicrobium sp. BvORR106 TaxID=1403819 RepID=UPI002240F8AE|nr:hypothetical protein [Verrucomicrobium sp. BvORR106]